MFAKTFCKPGSYLTIVPIGLRTTLQYNAKGVLEKIFKGYSDSKSDITSDLMHVVKSSKLVPMTIPITGGTTWIDGVFYTSKIFNTSGVLPMCIEGDIVIDMKTNPEDYIFYSGKVDSLAASFQAILTARNWLKMSKFHVLPMFMIPDRLSNEAFIKLVNTDKYPFKFPLISGYMIYQGVDYKYLPLNLVQKVVVDVDRFTDMDGYIKAIIKDSDGISSVYQYTDVLNYNINKHSVLVSKSNGQLIYSTSAPAAKQLNKLTCSQCGNVFVAPESGPVTCTDPHCLSKLYPEANRMLTIFGLPVLSYDKFKKYIDKNKIVCLTDVLLLPEYKDAKISVTMARMLQAVVPVDVCADVNQFLRISYLCNNSVKTLRYYIENTDRLAIEARDNMPVMLKRLIEWISVPYNATTLITLIDSTEVSIIETGKKFEGAPIFRGKTIAITGKFSHGDTSEIVSILKSYEGKVTVGVEEDLPDCLVIGDLNESIDGKSIKAAREHNITILTESELFERFEIDADINANLL